MTVDTGSIQFLSAQIVNVKNNLEAVEESTWEEAVKANLREIYRGQLRTYQNRIRARRIKNVDADTIRFADFLNRITN